MVDAGDGGRWVCTWRMGTDIRPYALKGYEMGPRLTLVGDLIKYDPTPGMPCATG